MSGAERGATYGMSGRASRAGRAGCRVWLIVFGIVDLSAGLDGIGFNYGGGETLSSKVIIHSQIPEPTQSVIAAGTRTYILIHPTKRRQAPVPDSNCVLIHVSSMRRSEFSVGARNRGLGLAKTQRSSELDRSIIQASHGTRFPPLTRE